MAEVAVEMPAAAPAAPDAKAVDSKPAKPGKKKTAFAKRNPVGFGTVQAEKRFAHALRVACRNVTHPPSQPHPQNCSGQPPPRPRVSPAP
jgi:hypothetical protein